MKAEEPKREASEALLRWNLGRGPGSLEAGGGERVAGWAESSGRDEARSSAAVSGENKKK